MLSVYIFSLQFSPQLLVINPSEPFTFHRLLEHCKALVFLFIVVNEAQPYLLIIVITFLVYILLEEFICCILSAGDFDGHQPLRSFLAAAKFLPKVDHAAYGFHKS